MVSISGYAKREEPWWVKIAIRTSIALALVGVLFGITFISQWLEDIARLKPAPPAPKVISPPADRQVEKITVVTKTTVVTSSTIVGKATVVTNPTIVGNPAVVVKGTTTDSFCFTSGVDNKNLPIDNLEKISLKSGKVFFYSRINSSVPRTIRHLWVNPDGVVVADIPLKLSHQVADTWSYLTLAGSKPGTWEVQLRNAKDKILARHSLLVLGL
jgi:hypothetical protein